MNEKDLKKVIKKLVRESLTEIFAEMQLEKIVESVISKNSSRMAVAETKKPSKFSVRETLAEAKVIPQQTTNTVNAKKAMLDKLKISDDTWSNIYADTAQSSNPILSKEEENATQEVPESVLESMGLMRDYSKFVNPSNTSQDDNEWKRKREDRVKVLSENIKRPA